ncbi:MAG: hypothetical protein AB7R89_12440 [Dehalococcoidia bacterium]
MGTRTAWENSKNVAVSSGKAAPSAPASLSSARAHSGSYEISASSSGMGAGDSLHDLCEQHGIEGLSRLGRHPNDRMVSFYIPTLSGWGVEWGWGARTVDAATWQVQTIRA